MAGSWRLPLCVLAITLLAASTASSFHGRFGMMRPPTVSNYYAVPIYCPPGPTVIPVPDAPRMPYAKPTAAPPSSTGEPPLAAPKASNDPRKPVIATSHAQGTSKAPAKDRCRVGFWNLSGHEVTVTIDGRTITLAKDRAATFDLEREFTWQVSGRPQNVERLPEGQATHEVLIRD